MGESEHRPRAGDPPQLDQPVEILRDMLAIERHRLDVAVAIEKKRDIVFPETSVIVRDIMKIMDAIAEIEKGDIKPEISKPESKKPKPISEID